jgi:hypothetical protein
MAAGALVEVEAGIGRHDLDQREATMWTGEGGLEGRRRERHVAPNEIS